MNASTHHAPLSLPRSAGLVLAAAASFQLAFLVTPLCWLVVVYLACLMELRHQSTPRRAFYAGLAAGLGVFVPQMAFLWTIFKAAAVPLWLILAAWHGVFVILLRESELRWGTSTMLLLTPILWTGLEFFRSELYHLRFSWFIAGSVFDHGLALNVPRWLGVYGAGFVAAVVAATGLAWRNRVGFSLRQRGLALAGAGVVAAMALVPPQIRTASAATSYQGGELRIAGTQLEFPAVPDVLAALDRLVAKHPGAELLVLSEYTFETPVPPSVKNWCRAHHRYLLAGAKQFAGSGKYYNIASVIGPDGLEVFQQAKSVPIQFFQDGIPAAHQSVWQSPWGTVGICVCYDLSYARVTDELIRQGARALIVPAMDVADWGEHQHELNRRVAFTRAAEYGVPIFRLASSGISQLVDHTGLELANAPFPGTEEMIHGTLDLETSNRPTLPWDRALASGCVAITASLVAFFLAVRARKRLSLLWSKSRSIATVPENS